jgi:hypothetical protein
MSYLHDINTLDITDPQGVPNTCRCLVVLLFGYLLYINL